MTPPPLAGSRANLDCLMAAVNPIQEWARCRPYIEAALAHAPGLERIEDVERAIERGSYQVWFGKECCAVTEIAHYAQAKALVVVHGGGDMAELLDELEPAMCAFAGARLHPDHGYRPQGLGARDAIARLPFRLDHDGEKFRIDPHPHASTGSA